MRGEEKQRSGEAAVEREVCDTGCRAPIDERSPAVMGLFPTAVAILDSNLEARHRFPLPSLVDGRVSDAPHPARLLDLLADDDRVAVGALLADLRTRPGHVETRTVRVDAPAHGWCAIELSFHNLLDDRDVQGIVVCLRNLTLVDRESRYRALVQHAPIGIFESDADGMCTFVNDAWCRIVGMRAEDALGHGWLRAVQPDDLARLRGEWRAAHDEGHVFGGEFRFVRPDGEEVWVRGRTVPVADATGRRVGHVGTIEDVTDSRRLLEMHAESERRLRQVLDHSLDIVVVVDGDGTLTYVSPAARRVLGYEPDDYVGTSVFDLVHPDDRARALSGFGRAATAGGTSTMQVRVRHADGSWRHVEVVGNYLVDDPAVAGIILNARDLTERDAAAAQLREVENRFELVFEHAAIGMNVTDNAGRFQRVNRAFCGMLGYTPEELLGMTCVDITHPDEVEETRASLAALVEGRGPSYTVEKRFRRADGTYVWVRVSAGAVRDDAGHASYLVGQVEDVTDRHLLEERLAHEAMHDRLTGLATRRLLLSEMDRSLAAMRRSDTKVAVLFIDLDGFKQVNDTFGHGIGDELLVAVGERLQALTRAGDVASRFGGDEFVVLADALPSVETALDLAQRLVHALAQPYDVHGHEVRIGASIGLAVASGDDPVSAEQLLSNADAAGYRAKRSGRGRVEVFDEELRRELSRRRRIDRAIVGLDARDDLPLLLRPIVYLETREVVGFQARVDWVELGLGETDAVHLVEESAYAHVVDAAIVRTAAALVARWQRELPGGTRPGVGVTLTNRGAGWPGLAKSVDDALADSGAPASLLWVGVPETAAARDFDAAVRVVDELSAAGIGVALSGFGGGVSSLDHLRRVNGGSLMLHESLVRALRGDDVSAALLTAIGRLARTLGLVVTATGAATMDEAARFAAFGCRLAVIGDLWNELRPDDVPRFLGDAG